MRYVGGKSRIASYIAAVIGTGVTYVEPFLGGGSVLEKIAPNFQTSYASDISEDLIIMWQALVDGWVPPESVSEDEYYMLMKSPPSALRGLAGFGSSYGGKFFEGYARGGFRRSGEPRNYFDESARNAAKIAKVMRDNNVRLKAIPYWDLNIHARHTVYCDPPYRIDMDRWGGKRETRNFGEFDHGKFWEVMDEWRNSGATVFVSEYEAPIDWECVAEFSHCRNLTLPGGERLPRTERLFMLK